MRFDVANDLIAPTSAGPRPDDYGISRASRR
jgi:hypothetical protein